MALTHEQHQTHRTSHDAGGGHETVTHGDHVDYLHGDHRHAPHGDHWDEH